MLDRFQNIAAGDYIRVLLAFDHNYEKIAVFMSMARLGGG